MGRDRQLGDRFPIDRFVTVYEVTRNYGGPQEGGWWWDCFTPVDTVAIPKVFQKRSMRADREVQKLVAKRKEAFQDRAEGDISSVNGGVLVTVYAENRKHQNATTEIPHYE